MRRLSKIMSIINDLLSWKYTLTSYKENIISYLTLNSDVTLRMCPVWPVFSSHWRAYRIDRPPSVVHTLKIFSSRTTGPIEARFHMESPWDGGTKVCSNGPGHLTKTAAMPEPFKNLLLRFQPKGWWPWNLVCSIGCSSTTKFVQMMTLGWPWPILRQGQIWSLMLLYGK